MKILYATSELCPLIKSGGLADVSNYLCMALNQAGVDIRIILPAYRVVFQTLAPLNPELRQVARFTVYGCPYWIKIFETRFPGTDVLLYLVDIPEYFDREGGAYGDPFQREWLDNADRFITFSRVVSQVSAGQAGMSWMPDIIHCNDWPTGAVPAFMQYMNKPDIKRVFTIHNLAYRGLYSDSKVNHLGIPLSFWQSDQLEFYGQISLLKGGVVTSDYVTTVSPTYSNEILHPFFGEGLEGVLHERMDTLQGILNGVDDTVWNPVTDKLIAKNYSIDSLDDKAVNKAALQKAFNLPQEANIPVIGCVSRLAYQKGLDLIVQIADQFAHYPVQWVFLGAGESYYQDALHTIQARYPNHVGIFIGYNEQLAHLVEAGSDMFVMPSRYEPCGLNQLYSLKYGTIPIVHATGGLRDTVVNMTLETTRNRTANGFMFYEFSAERFADALHRAIQVYNEQPEQWRSLMKNGMKADFSWSRSAEQYIELYEKLLRKKPVDWSGLMRHNS